MRKIKFKNDETTVSQETFLAFQENIIEAIDGITLFENWAGVSGDVELGEDVSQFSSIKIFAGKGEIGITTVEIPLALYDQKINITQAQFVENLRTLQLVEKQFYLFNTKLKVHGTPSYINFTNSVITEQGSENLVLVYKVVGYK